MAEQHADHLVLGNGVRIILVPKKAMPVTAVNVRMEVGSRHELPGGTGLAHLFEHLMFAATKHLPSGDHMRTIEELGGYTNATTTTDSTTYFETVPPQGLRLALWMEGERLANLPAAIDPNVLEVQREVVRNERRQSVDNTPYGETRELIAAAMFPSPHPYDHTPAGSAADIDRAGLDDVHAFFRDHYVAERTLVAVTGAFDPADAADTVERCFSSLPSGRPATVTAPQAPLPVERIRIERRSAAPSNLVIAHRLPPAPTRQHAAAELLAALLAGGQGARLNRRLKRETALAVNVSFTVNPMIGGDSTAMARLRPGLHADLDALEAAYLGELASLAQAGPSEEEFDRARAQWLAGWLTRTESVEGLAEELTWQWMASAAPPQPGQARARVESVTVEDLRLCAAALMEARRVTLTFRNV